jgi:1-aminocyclopropane-1-carboxylate deaminase
MNTDFLSTENIPLEEISHPLLKAYEIKLLIKRDDLIHPFISGNKWRKLKYNIAEMERQGKTTMLTFGGAYSNHILATAAAGDKLGFKTIGIIRGEEPRERNSILKKAEELGMKFHFVTRGEYRQKETKDFLDRLKNMFGNFYPVPEGGSNESGVKGCTEIEVEIKANYNYLCCCCGTGTTLAGIALSLPPGKTAIGFCVHKGDEAVEENIMRWTSASSNYMLVNDYHFGGFAKSTDELRAFAHDFSMQTGIPIEPVYTAKMFFGIFDLIKKDFFKRNSVLVALHTGGIHLHL